MRHPAFQNLPRTFFFTGICLLVGLAIFVSLIGLVPFRAGLLILDVLILSFLFGCISLLLWYVVCFADLAGNNNLQRIINYSALVILSIVVWLGVDYLFLYLFFSKVGQKIYVIATTDIVFLQAEGDYVMIHTAAGHFIKEQTMKYFEEHSPPAKFVRIHRSTIVNINMISRIELYEKQFYQITLLSGQQLKASASGYRLLKNTLQL